MIKALAAKAHTNFVLTDGDGSVPNPTRSASVALTGEVDTVRSGTATTAQGTGSTQQGPASQARPQIPQPPKPQGPSR